jgi:orotate phosphoribosyltransferase-like protein
MAYFYEDWKHKKLTVEDSEGQFIMNFGEAERSMIKNIDTMIEQGKTVEYLEYLKECLQKGKVELKWNIS